MTTTTRPAKRSEARERLLATATGLFYAEGIKSVGVDRIIAESNVTLATFYRHFPGKEALVVAYLQNVHDLIVEATTASTSAVEGSDLVRTLGAAVIAELDQESFRGCAFINAASEFEDAESPVRQVIAAHRRWYFELVRRAMAQAGHQRPGNAARHFLMLRDGAMIGGSLDSPTAAKRIFNRGVDGLLRSIDYAGLASTGDDEA